MRIGLLGTGIVGRTLGTALVELGHEVQMGSRGSASAEAQAWSGAAGPRARLGTFARAAEFGELLVNATSGAGSLQAIGSCPTATLEGKVMVDVANPLDFSGGFPPILSVVNDDSLGERIQAAFPGLRVVKTFNTMAASLMVNPALVPGHHNVFHSGNDAGAKATVGALQQSMGWAAEDILDLGDITTARGPEMYLPLWLRLFGLAGSPNFNLNVVRG
ncbi:MAG: hypothetical protein NVSMB17_07150 [Candidatus Dormibacteria bacterium]